MNSVTMEASTKNETNEMIKRFSGIYLNKVDVVDETKNDSALKTLDLKKLVQESRSKNLEIKINAITEIRKLLSDRESPPIDEIIANEIVPELIEYLKNSDTKLQYEAAWILTNIASSTFEQTKVIVDGGAVPIFLQLLHSTDHNVSNQVAWALGNIIADKTQFYNYCIELGLIEEILKFDFSKFRIKNLRTLTWIIANLCRNKELCPAKNIGLQFLPILELLVCNKDDEILVQTLLAMTFLTDPNDDEKIVLNDTTVKQLVEFLNHRDIQIQSSALTILTYITFNNDDKIKLLLDYGILTLIEPFLIHPKTRINKQACLFLSSIINDKGHWNQEIFDANLVEPLIKLLSQNHFGIKKDALSVLVKLINQGNTKQIQYMILNNIIPSLCSLIHETAKDEILESVLKSIKTILEKSKTYFPIVIQQLNENGIKEKVEKLSIHKNADIFNIVKEIKVIYFSFE